MSWGRNVSLPKMADTSEPVSKKRRFDDIFRKISDKNGGGRVRRQLETVVTCLEKGLNCLVVRELKVLDANANRSVPFKRASICMDKYQNTYALGTIFKQGYSVLSKYLQSDISKGEIFVPEDASYRKALELLLKFVDTHQEVDILKQDDKLEEWHWKLQLAQHLFSKLAINPHFTYDIATNYDATLGCPCPVNEILDGEHGDTSFGCEKGWHGKVDILMSDVPICPVLDEPVQMRACSPLPSSSASVTSETDSCSDIEEKIKFNDSDYSKIVAETITYSFLRNKGKCAQEVTLIPSVSINRMGVQCYFYDSVNDVLLQSGNIILIPPKSYTNKFNVIGIVLIWLTLNHKLFCTGILPEMKRSGFHKLIDLHMYEEEVIAPCTIRQNPEKPDISDTSWALTTDAVDIREVCSLEPVPVINLLQESRN